MRNVGRWIFASAVALGAAGCATAPSEPMRLAGQACASPPAEHCPDADCPSALLSEGGPAVESKTGRSYFLDYPCDLKPGEPVTLVLSLHGAGSSGNWMRHYFPLVDNVEAHRLVVATPNTPELLWSSDDDGYLENIAAELIDEIGPSNISSFWLAGHSYGGLTSNRIVCSDFFADKVDGWLSLSGGRIGAATVSPAFGAPPDASGAFPPIEGANGPEPSAMGKGVPPACDISYIFATGENEITGLPEESPWADKYGCGPRRLEGEVVDEKAGYVGGSTPPGEAPNLAQGREPRPGRAEVLVYPGCRGGMLVADVLRFDKGHTEGLEPRIAERIIEMMQAAPGGKLRRMAGG